MKTKTIVTFFGILLTGIALSIFSVLIVKHIQFERNCGGYLKRAADANTVKLAKEQLIIAINYIEDHQLTNGYTSVIYTTPDEDLGFWYDNINQSFIELNQLDTFATALEKSNVLMKLGETLLDNNSGKTSVTIPDGISRFPNNKEWVIALFFAFLGLSGAAIIFLPYMDEI